MESYGGGQLLFPPLFPPPLRIAQIFPFRNLDFSVLLVAKYRYDVCGM